jgi:hypothetical protein
VIKTQNNEHSEIATKEKQNERVYIEDCCENGIGSDKQIDLLNEKESIFQCIKQMKIEHFGLRLASF